MTEATLTVGQPAPAFTLPDQNDTPVSLDDFKGRWVVLYFYPKDDTPGCTTEACDFTEGLDTFDMMNAVVLGCSPDDPASHRQFIEKYDLKITLLSDVDRQVLNTYGAWGEKRMFGQVREGVLRSTVVINPNGIVAHHWKNVRAAGHAAQVRQKLSQLQT